MSKIMNKFSPEVRERAVRMVIEYEGEHASRWAAIVSLAAKIGCSANTLHEWVKKTEVDSGKRVGTPSRSCSGRFRRVHRGDWRRADEAAAS
jgi:transposase-like protein